MSVLFMFLLYLFSLFFAVISVISKWLTILLGLPLLLFSVLRLRRYFGYVAMIFAGMAAWVTGISIINALLEWPIHRLLVLVFTVISSISVGIGLFHSYRKYYHEDPKIRMRVKKQPKSSREQLESIDEVVRYKKEKMREFGWIGLFMNKKDEEMFEPDNSLEFRLGEKVEVEKKKTRS